MTGPVVLDPTGGVPDRPGPAGAARVPGTRTPPSAAAASELTVRHVPGGPGDLDPDLPPAPVVAVVVAHDGAEWLPRSLDALARSRRRPDVVVAVDTGSLDRSRELLEASPLVDDVVALARTAPPGEAVTVGAERAIALLALRADPLAGRSPSNAGWDRPSPWVWVLHDDCAPEPDTLDLLLDSVAAAPTVAVAGCKLVAWDDPGLLHEVGVTVSPTGRRLTDLTPGERDQGQHDARSDVLAVSTAGALLRWDVIRTIGGFDPMVPLAGDDIDLCRRVRMAGHRVVVVPAARCSHAAALESGRRAGDALLGPRAARRRRGPSGDRLRPHRRRHAMYSRVVAAGWWRALPALVWLLLEVAVVATAHLLARRPVTAAGEVAAWWAVASTPWRLVAGLRRTGATRPSGRAAVRTLQPSSWRMAADRVDHAAGEVARKVSAARPHPVIVVAAVAAILSWLAARVQRPTADDLVDGGAGIRTLAADGLTAAEMWQRATSAVAGTAATAQAPPDPAAAVWAAVSAAAAIGRGIPASDGTFADGAWWAGWVSVPLAVLTAWALAREVLPGRRAAVAVAAVWALLPGLAAAAGTSYATTADERVVHAVAPLVVWAVAVALRAARVPWLGAPVAVGGAAAVVVVALQPTAWPVVAALAVGAVIVLGARGGSMRRRAARAVAVVAIAVAPAAVFPAWAVAAWSSPALLLLPPAHREAGVAPDAYLPDGPSAWAALVVLALTGAVAAAAAGLGALRSGAGRVALAGVVLLAVWAVVSGGVPVDLARGATRAADAVWVAPLAALLVASAAGLAGRRARRVPLRLAVGAGAVLLGAWVVMGSSPPVPAAVGLPVPAAVEAAPPSSLATLVLTAVPDTDGSGPAVTWSLERGQPGPGSQGSAAQVGQEPDADVEALATAVLGRSDETEDAAQARRALDSLAVGWVVVDGPAAAEGSAPAAALDAVAAAVGTRPGLVEVARVPGRVAWRVQRDEGDALVGPSAATLTRAPWATVLPWAAGGIAVLLLMSAVGRDRRTGAPAAPASPAAAARPAAPTGGLAVATSLTATLTGIALVVSVGLLAARGSSDDPARAVTLAAPGERLACPGDTAAVAPAGSGPDDAGADYAAEVAVAMGDDPRSAAVQAGRTTAGTGTGSLTLSSCPPARDVGYAFTGGTAPGQRPRLVLENPGDVPAAVSVELLTPTGRQPAGEGGSLTVEPRSTEAVAVDALAVVDGVTAVEVRAEPGAIAATLRDSAEDGLRSAGTDDEAFAVPGTRLVVPVVTAPPPGGRGTAGTRGAVVALAVPGDDGGVARVTVVPTAAVTSPEGTRDSPAAPRPPETQAVPVVPGATVIVPVTTEGTYAVLIDSDVPVVAAARSVAPGTDGAVDIGWAAAVVPRDVTVTGVPVPDLPAGVRARLHIATAGEVVLDVDVVDAAGAVAGTRRLTVPAGGAVSVALDEVAGPGAAAVRVRAATDPADGAGGAVIGAVGLSVAGQGGVATTTVVPRVVEGEVVRLIPD